MSTLSTKTGEFTSIDNPPTRIVSEDQIRHNSPALQWEYCNEEEHFWDNAYAVSLATIGGYFLVNADTAQDALDSAIDCAEERGYMGYFIDNPTESDYETATIGGNHGLAVPEGEVHITQLSTFPNPS